MHSSCFKALHDRGSLRLKQAQSREFKATSLTLTCSHPPQLINWVRGMLSLASWPQTFIKNLAWHTRNKHMISELILQRLTDHAFVAPSHARDWHGHPFPPHGKLAQSFSLQWRIFWAFSRLVFKYSARCWPRGVTPRAKVASSGPSLASFLPTRYHSMT